MVITCKMCDKDFAQAYKGEHYCSKKCKDLAYRYSGAAKRFKIFKRDKFRCKYCGVSSIEDRIELHLDHVIPRACGGSDDASNLATACRACNTAKKDDRLDPETENRVLLAIKAG